MMPSVMMARVMLLLLVDDEEEDDMMIAMVEVNLVNEMSDST
jgi:hypothetical protein